MQRPAVLITGSGGFLAKRILSELLDAESPLVPSRIVLLDIADQKLNIVDTRIVTYQGDIRNPNSIAAAFRGIDIVFHW
jgi:nucleoside-diphosphate-sugar epimerase